MISVSLNKCEFNKNNKVLKLKSFDLPLSSPRFPQQIKIVSHHTGKEILFKVDEQRAIENEFWDGEQMEYIPTTKCNVLKLVIYNCQ